MRLDQYLSAKFSELSRSKIQKMIKNGEILVNGKRVKSGSNIKETDDIHIKKARPERGLRAEKIDLDIIYEDKDILVINKPANMVVHPGDGRSHMSGTVVNAVLDRIKDVEKFANLRPGVVHRLDKDTSGLLLLAKNIDSYNYFVEQFKKKTMRKTYLALVAGTPEYDEGMIDSPIARDPRSRKKMTIVAEKQGKQALTIYKVLKKFQFEDKKFSLLEVEIKTGRTHQIRVHMKNIGCYVVGDIVYGNKSANALFRDEFGLSRQFLHAWKLTFKHMNGKEISLMAKLPVELESIISRLSSLAQ